MALQNRFYELLLKYTKNLKTIDLLWKNIESKYHEKHRFYHNISHLEDIFNYYDIYKTELKNSDEVAFAIFYHDIIYKLFKNDNEEKSAVLAQKELSFLNFKTENIVNHILATKSHEGNTIDTKYMIDFDLAILGESTERYKKYAQNIRKEYKICPDFIYNNGRIKVLNQFLNKPRIYKTQPFIRKYEKQARKNICSELIELIKKK